MIKLTKALFAKDGESVPHYIPALGGTFHLRRMTTAFFQELEELGLAEDIEKGKRRKKTKADRKAEREAALAQKIAIFMKACTGWDDDFEDEDGDPITYSEEVVKHLIDARCKVERDGQIIMTTVSDLILGEALLLGTKADEDDEGN